MAKVKRRYSSPRREQQARETRRAVLDAALELFTRNGFAETSIREIAERAQVSEQTIYNGFADKIGLLQAAGMEYADLSAGREAAAFLETLRAEPDPVERIRMVARSSRQIWESGAIELEMLVLNHEIRDPRMEELERIAMQQKLDSTRETCQVLFPDALRRPGLSLDDIVVFATAVDAGSVVKAVLELGWSMDQWEEWLVQLMTLFLDPAPSVKR
jgi:TetR/AcrR family transcriptional regulator, regulator of autoinduction and epiphytic fitness